MYTIVNTNLFEKAKGKIAKQTFIILSNAH